MNIKKQLKRLYSVIPLKREIYTLLRSVIKPDAAIYRHLHFKSAFKVRMDDGRRFWLHNGDEIENEIFWEGLLGKWEKESLKLWIRLCEDADCIFDIGANSGVYSLVAKTVRPEAKVFAFEPHPLIFGTLTRNVIKNNYDITCIDKAVSDIDGRLMVPDYSGQSAGVMVDAVRLDTFINQNNPGKVDLLKIDVETHEPAVLEGFQYYLSRFRPAILIEILSDDIADRIHEIAGGYGYLYFNIDERGGVRQTARIQKSDYYNYLLCDKKTASRLGLA